MLYRIRNGTTTSGDVLLLFVCLGLAFVIGLLIGVGLL